LERKRSRLPTKCGTWGVCDTYGSGTTGRGLVFSQLCTKSEYEGVLKQKRYNLTDEGDKRELTNVRKSAGGCRAQQNDGGGKLQHGAFVSNRLEHEVYRSKTIPGQTPSFGNTDNTLSRQNVTGSTSRGRGHGTVSIKQGDLDGATGTSGQQTNEACACVTSKLTGVNSAQKWEQHEDKQD